MLLWLILIFYVFLSLVFQVVSKEKGFEKSHVRNLWNIEVETFWKSVIFLIECTRNIKKYFQLEIKLKLGVACTRLRSWILIGTSLFVRNLILITKVKKNRNRLRIQRLSFVFYLSDEDRKKKCFFGFEKKSFIDRISCFSINMAHMTLHPYLKKIPSTNIYFCLECQKSNFWGAN